MKRTFLILVMVAVIVVTACQGCASVNQAGLVKELNHLSWTSYTEPEVYASFEEEYGVRISETTHSGNEEVLAKLQGGATGFDVIVVSDYMVATMIELGMLAELDKSQLSNINNLDPFFADPPYDPGLTHCVPYMWGTTGIGFDRDYFESPPDSWSYFFDPAIAAQYKGKFSLLDDPIEVIAAALKYLGYSANSSDPQEIEEAKQVIMTIKPYVHFFDSVQYKNLLTTGEIVMAHGWSGEVFQAIVEDDSLDYVIPKEGGLVWVDNLCIPQEVVKDPRRYRTALTWLNYLLRPDIAVTNVEYVYFASPNEAAYPQLPEEIRDDPRIYPPEATMKKLEWSQALGEAQQLREQAWTEIKSK